jgi:hypothetical protein
MPSWFEFLRIEAALALTFIEVARTANDPSRPLGKANMALAEIQRGLMNPERRGLSEYEVEFLVERRAEIETRLAEFAN